MTKDSATYHKLITAAADCFAEKGFNATSVREIALRAGISQGAMYTYFRSKDELISAIVLEEQKSALNAQNESFSGSFLERICSLVSSCISDVGYPATHRLWVEIIAESARNTSLGNTFISSDIAMRHGIGNIIRQGIESGEFRKNLVVEETTIVIFAIIDGLIARKAINKDFSPHKDLSTFSDVLRHLLT
ncbi:TetR/AcrR family transcriptional regulator [Pantoea phytobeneficialis]|uniref:TetR family transcriptional regulator n=1 Tax=Pantoea phytobeneficialis TaxID=2052056 RepID=A0AAP9KS64_9GAMM|nr:TetR/AcrR family transcriptional regulator [Pantoea phytobeneficialis]MDO6409906.1 TetR/AcrR family transcriptional regulator [Pantoea phytobeneficialis]QGR09775.1 TetR family transcriptional regulator [Pantoea phytobeneficialis]